MAIQKFLTIREAALYKNVTRQAVYLAVKLGRIKTYQVGKLLKVCIADIEEYERNKCSRMVSVFQGQKIYSDEKGKLSIIKAAGILEISRERVYYAARMGYLKAERKGCAWVIDLKDLNKFRDLYLTDFTSGRVEYLKKTS